MNSDALTSTLTPSLGIQNAKLATTNIYNNYSLLPQSLPANIRQHAFRLVYNAVPTLHRLDPHHRTFALCHLCGDARETLSHLHSECKVSRAAAHRIINARPNKDPFLCLNTTDPSDFIFRSTIAKDKDNLHRTLFSFAVWKTRCSALASPNTQGLQFAIHSLFEKLLKSIEKQKSKAKRDKSAEKLAFISGLDSIPPEDLSIYTDGSSFGNPGPSGAGFVVLPNSTCPEHHYSIDIGHSTNNVAELVGIEKACSFLLSTLSGSSCPKVHIYIDNQYAIRMADSTGRARANRRQVKLTREALTNLRLITSVSLHWVPGHACTRWRPWQRARGPPCETRCKRQHLTRSFILRGESIFHPACPPSPDSETTDVAT